MRPVLRGGALLAGLLLLAPAATVHADDAQGERMDRDTRRASKAERQAKRAERRAQMTVKREAKRFRKVRLEGSSLQDRVDRLTGELTWHETLAAAQVEAKQQDKPILWVQALGDLRGVL